MQIQPFSIKTIKVLLISISIYVLFQWIPTSDNVILSIIVKSVLIILMFFPPLIFIRISYDINDIYNTLKSRLYELLSLMVNLLMMILNLIKKTNYFHQYHVL